MFLFAGTTALIIWLLAIILWIVAIVDIIKSSAPGNTKILWLIIVLVLPFLGTILYFLIGRGNTV